MELLLFGVTKEIVGKSKLTITADKSIPDVGSLKQWLALQYPALSALKSLAIAVDNEYAGDGETLKEGSEIALIPPVSGG
ncbi:MAG TPA: molybdopterin converting factor subunit 1 [Chitinophagaceae bacterium]|nr:molybdopterin converting factor subunit 1 [Chitinophagaceae bacterium]